MLKERARAKKVLLAIHKTKMLGLHSQTWFVYCEGQISWTYASCLLQTINSRTTHNLTDYMANLIWLECHAEKNSLAPASFNAYTSLRGLPSLHQICLNTEKTICCWLFMCKSAFMRCKPTWFLAGIDTHDSSHSRQSLSEIVIPVEVHPPYLSRGQVEDDVMNGFLSHCDHARPNSPTRGSTCVDLRRRERASNTFSVLRNNWVRGIVDVQQDC